MSAPGELGSYDPAFVARHAPWIEGLLRRWFRARIHGLDAVPDAPALFVGNHSGAAMIPDTLVWVGAYHTAGRRTPMLTLAHDQMFEAYPALVASFLARMGGLRAGRARALEALASGHALTVYPGGDYDACRPFSRRHTIELAGRTGYVELARDAGVPIVPVVSVGAHEALVVLWDGRWLARRLPFARARRLTVFPLTLSVPWGLFLGPLPGYVPLPTKIELRVLDAIDPTDGRVDEVDRRVRASLQEALDAMAKARRFPWIG
ncbi:MAG: hypothetical protein KF729_12320 [Sandaracinaceae bacterium]|nr:hypothetical protein [Sandaracinaceae bacterium]